MLEPMMTLRAKVDCVISGITYKAGQIFQVPASDGLSLVAMGSVEQVPDPSTMVQSPVQSYSLYVDHTMGTFSQAVLFPKGSILLWCVLMPYTTFTGGIKDTTVTLGTAADRNDVLDSNGFGPMHHINMQPVTGTLPFAVDPNPFELWVRVDGNENTQGKGVITLISVQTEASWWDIAE